MLKLRSSWRPLLLWILLLAGIGILFAREPRLNSLISQGRDLYHLLLEGDLGLLQDRRVIQTAAQVFLVSSLALTVLAFLLLRLIRAFYGVLAHRYVVTDDRVIARHGLIARDYREGYRLDFRGAAIKQGVLDRLLGIGDLTISTIGGAGLVVLFKKIAAPLKLKHLIFGGELPPTAKIALPAPASAAPATAPKPSKFKLNKSDKAPKNPPAVKPANSLLEAKFFDDEDDEESLTQVDPDIK